MEDGACMMKVMFFKFQLICIEYPFTMILAAPHFTAMVDQSSFGHQFLMQEFNITPQIGWQIDPFGKNIRIYLVGYAASEN